MKELFPVQLQSKNTYLFVNKYDFKYVILIHLMKYSFRKDQISIQNHSEEAAFADQVRLKYLSKIGFILSEKEGVAFTKVMTRQQLSVSEVLIYEASI